MKRRRSERGVALIICLFALMLLSGIGLGMMYMADTETSINRNYRDAQQAYFAATAGVQEVRERLTPTSTTVLTAAQTPSTLPAAAATTGVTYILNYTGSIASGDIQPWDVSSKYFDTELCHENFPGLPNLTNTGPNTPCSTAVTGSSGSTCTYCTHVDSNLPPDLLGTNANLAYRWVRITQKTNAAAVPATPSALQNSFFVNAWNSANNVPICWNGFAELPLDTTGHGPTCDVDPPLDGVYMKSVYVLTALAVTQNGSRRMAQMEVANNPPFVTNAAVDSKDHVSLSGQLTVNGYDNCSCACTTSSGVTTCTDRPGKICDRSKWAIYSNGTVDNPNASETIVAGRSPAIAKCDAAHGITTGCSWPYDIPAMISQYKPGAVDVTTSPNYPGWSCSGSPGSLQCGTHTGGIFGVPPTFPPNPVDNPTGPSNMASQITYVPGSVKLTAGSVGYGILIVDGDLEINGGLQFYGLILVRGVISFTGGGSDRTNIYGAVLAGEESLDNTSLGGSAVIDFDRCALTRNQTPQPPSLLATHEVSY